MSLDVAIIWICAGLAAVIFGVMLWSVATFQRRMAPGRRELGASYLHSTLVEVLWALIPILILVSAAAPAIKTLATLP